MEPYTMEEAVAVIETLGLKGKDPYAPGTEYSNQQSSFGIIKAATVDAAYQKWSRAYEVHLASRWTRDHKGIARKGTTHSSNGPRLNCPKHLSIFSNTR